MATPEEVAVWIGLDVGKTDHHTCVLNDDGDTLIDRPVTNDQTDLERLIDTAAGHGQPGLAIDQPGSIAQLAIAVAAARGVPVAYIPGLVMRRAADLYPGEAKTDRRDAHVIADTARTRRGQIHWLDTQSDELLDQLRVLNGFDIDLAADVVRLSNRLRDALTSISPALERALGDRLHQPGIRDLLAKHPTPTALHSAGRARIKRTISKRSPRLADKVTTTVMTALDAQTPDVARGSHVRPGHRRPGNRSRPHPRPPRRPRQGDRGGLPRPPFRAAAGHHVGDRATDRIADPGRDR